MMPESYLKFGDDSCNTLGDMGPGGASCKPSVSGAGGLGFDSRCLPSFGLSVPPASTRSEMGSWLLRWRSLETEKELSYK